MVSIIETAENKYSLQVINLLKQVKLADEFNSLNSSKRTKIVRLFIVYTNLPNLFLKLEESKKLKKLFSFSINPILSTLETSGFIVKNKTGSSYSKVSFKVEDFLRKNIEFSRNGWKDENPYIQEKEKKKEEPAKIISPISPPPPNGTIPVKLVKVLPEIKEEEIEEEVIIPPEPEVDEVLSPTVDPVDIGEPEYSYELHHAVRGKGENETDSPFNNIKTKSLERHSYRSEGRVSGERGGKFNNSFDRLEWLYNKIQLYYPGISVRKFLEMHLIATSTTSKENI